MIRTGVRRGQSGENDEENRGEERADRRMMKRTGVGRGQSGENDEENKGEERAVRRD